MSSNGSNGHWTGFVPVRRGILDHCERGELPPLEFSIYIHLILLADAGTGVAWSSAKSLSERFGYASRYARQLLEALESKGYIRRFAIPGRHGQYAILVNKYCASRGARKNLFVNAAKSNDWRNPVFDNCEEDREVFSEDNASVIGRQEGKEQGQITTLSPSAPRNGNGHSNGKGHTQDFAQMLGRLVQFYRERIDVRFYKLDGDFGTGKKKMIRREFILGRLKEVYDFIREQEPNLDHPSLIANTESALQHVIEDFSQDDFMMGRKAPHEYPSGKQTKYSGLAEYILKDWSRIERRLNS